MSLLARCVVRTTAYEVRPVLSYWSRWQVLVIEAAIMLEAGWDKLIDRVWAVCVAPDVAVARLVPDSVPRHLPGRFLTVVFRTDVPESLSNVAAVPTLCGRSLTPRGWRLAAGRLMKRNSLSEEEARPLLPAPLALRPTCCSLLAAAASRRSQLACAIGFSHDQACCTCSWRWWWLVVVEQARKRLNSQMGNDQRIARAQRTIWNDGDLAALKAQLGTAWTALISSAGA